MNRRDVSRPYHHGNLRRALLDAALQLVGEHGPTALSLREVARRAGVSHAAPTHHFRNKGGLLTAIGAEGYRMLADALAVVSSSFREQGVAYVVFATSHPAHFAVMRAADLLDDDDPDLTDAREAAAGHLRGGAERLSGTTDPATRLAAWALVHGLASLILEGNVRPGPGEDIASLAWGVTGQLAPLGPDPV